MVSGRVRDDIPALLRDNEQLKQRDAELTAQLEEAVGKIEANEAAAASTIIEGILAAGTCASDSLEGGLDLGKLCART